MQLRRYLISLKYNNNFCVLSILVRKLLPAIVRLLDIPNTEETYSFMFLRQTLSCYNLKVVLLLNL